MSIADLMSKHEVLCKNGPTNLGERIADGKDFIGLYFSAHWCPPCRGFTPQLAHWYKKQTRAELIFVSSDNDQAAFQEYYAEMPWKAFPFDPKLKDALSKRFSVQGIPTLIIFDAHTGALITDEARADITEDVDFAFSQWTPEVVKEKQVIKQRAKEQMKRELPVLVQAELSKVMLVDDTDRILLAELLGKVAAQEFGQPLPAANLQHAVANMFGAFDKQNSGRISPDSMAHTVCQWLDGVSDPDEVAHYLKPENVRELVFMRFLKEAQEEALKDAEWAADGVAVQQLKAIFAKFDQDGDGRLLKSEFEALIQATLGKELDGLYEHLNEESGSGVEAKELYTVVYSEVFAGRREGDVVAQIGQDHSALCAPSSKL